ncbi:hypothetical protein Ocin01_10787 [Orchesella cincta]|uniref:Uncharacterized protein n=1 Tax=Orchesella cincta TaxID=48709 RepID=A0A1D2MSK2_ORCCI|nr:hypothetical protein Ocin01_10787 [Orchesella cincta]
MIKKEINRFRSWDATALTFFISVVILSVTSDVAAGPVINKRIPLHFEMDESGESQKPVPSSLNSSQGNFSHPDFERSSAIRLKRSPYPPGFVTWTIREPCICSPGQLICRCYSTSSASLEASQKSRRRRSRTKKSKSN